ncbi:MAG: DNA polymerase-3 subunit gamma/tau [Cellvibrionaceae bacterium]|jgi:DNA polymerase-3 subunit gamma/tau
MSYQVLARKWRPRLFREMVGQEHVLKALINALDHDRLHHAYLFTGTRGVGKTTIARILAKCLNCEVGVSSEPCNQCSSCTEINEGRFIDLIEVDAASRTKVEDTRDLLENVQYAPTRGRYKVYLIDEVHMLSNSSFNALLKTLEEPPPHVKFLLATTDPHKLPVTVLSRCLQFSLKNMSAERIVGHLEAILTKEMVPFEEAGLWQLGRAADGSMRDALSLTDQSIAYSNGKVTENDVRTMLGTIDQSLVQHVLKALVEEDGQAILNSVAQMAEHAPDYSNVLAELIALLHRIAIAQVLPEAIDNSLGDRQQIYDFAQTMAAEDVQLYYQTALLGRRDLLLSPDPRGGFEMVMLRMLAFKPQGLMELPVKSLTKNTRPIVSDAQVSAKNVEHNVGPAACTLSEAQPLAEQSVAQPPALSNLNEGASDPVKKPEALIQATPLTVVAPQISLPATVGEQAAELKQLDGVLDGESCLDVMLAEPIHTESRHTKLKAIEPENETLNQDPQFKKQLVPKASEDSSSPKKNKKSIDLQSLSSENWLDVYQQLATGGLLQSTVANCAYSGIENSCILFILDEQQSTLYDANHQQRLADLLSEYFGQILDVEIKLGQPQSETPSQIILRMQKERQQQAEVAINTDPVVQQLQETFGAVIVDDSIKPID